MAGSCEHRNKLAEQLFYVSTITQCKWSWKTVSGVHTLQVSSISGLDKLLFFLTRVNENDKNVPVFSVP
jgi:hypothetical protein